MMALTKAEMADKLFDQLGLNKERRKNWSKASLNVYVIHWKTGSKLNYRVLEILT